MNKETPDQTRVIPEWSQSGPRMVPEWSQRQSGEHWIPAIGWTWTARFWIPGQTALWSHDLASLWQLLPQNQPKQSVQYKSQQNVKSSWSVTGHDRVHLATGMVVAHGVIGEGAILTNCFTKWWLLAYIHGKPHSRTCVGRSSTKAFSFFSFPPYILKVKKSADSTFQSKKICGKSA